MEGMEQACADIAGFRGILPAPDDKEDIKEIVRQYLNGESAGQWLLIVDNADDMELLFGTRQSISQRPSFREGQWRRAAALLSRTPVRIPNPQSRPEKARYERGLNMKRYTNGHILPPTP